MQPGLGGRGDVKPGGAAEDLVVQLAEPGSGLGSELISQDAPGLLIDGQGAGRVPGPAAGEHQLVPQSLPQRMPGGGYCTLAALTPATLGDVVECQ